MKIVDSKNMKDYWKRRADDFAGLYARHAYLSPKFIVFQFLHKRTKILQDMCSLQKCDKLLDVGCGSGVHMKLCIPQCNHVTGIDYSEKMIALAKDELRSIDESKWDVHVGDAMRVPFQNQEFDWVISMGLLDYVDEPRKVLSECWRVLKDEGHIICTIPKNPSVFSCLRTRFGNAIKKYVFHLPPIRNIYTRSSLESLLESENFQCEEIQSVWTTMWIVKAVKKSV
ncbi:MAG: class I SAM-dependent methyltransferase [bacterium]|nr:class I SAM-dependent methyltransferase [bacterium]